MDEVIFLEVLEGDGVHARHRLERFPASVGRGYTNDVILDDPKVSAEHLRIERREDGALVLRDVGSHNGTFRVEPWTQLAELELTPDTRVSVGDTVLRFRARNHPVEDTVVGPAPVAPRPRVFERPRTFALALAALVGASLLEGYLTNYGRTDWGELTVSVVVPLALLLLWAGGWSVASRIARRQFHYRTHAAIGTLVLLGTIIIPALVTLVSFSLALGGGLPVLHYLAFLGLMGWGLYWHLRYVTRWDSRRLKRVLAVVTLVFGVLSRAGDLLGNEGFDAGLDFPRTLLPPALRLARAQPVEEFFEDTAGLQDEVDALTKEE
ncbi:FHA domain-containing protein [Pyxidicoccus parkwayensis]|uniref:FHA domain-containing protein n=1 Tax=Pyxidicoccus parkwayensis TaxID=2813578 RepID=A0ABX7P5N9_9BACT|nr:FHA domain-containing protein [Pyxidicoccus parkwaysis]QSQ25766.1 FHA domain-containing protein [Pyxidicoccus parkwaysis]